jgi:hypothetical protein
VSKRYGFPLFVSIVDGRILHLRTVNSYYAECERFSPGIRFILSGNFWLFLKSYLLNHFFRDAIPKKESFQISEPIYTFLTIKSDS